MLYIAPCFSPLEGGEVEGPGAPELEDGRAGAPVPVYRRTSSSQETSLLYQGTPSFRYSCTPPYGYPTFPALLPDTSATPLILEVDRRLHKDASYQNM